MKVTEQIDALTTLSTDPIKYLVVPRLVAAILTVPLLVGSEGKQKKSSEKQVMRNMKMNITNYEIKQHYWHNQKRNHI